MNPIKKIFIMLILCGSYALIETASINMTLSSPNIQNGSSLDVIAKFDPTIGDSNLNNVYCEYIPPGESGSIILTSYFFSFNRLVINSRLPASESARLTITTIVNQTVLTISPITFNDEKRVFFCSLEHIVGGSTLFTVRSEKHKLENVYSPVVLNEAGSIQPSTLFTEGVPASLTCIATGRPAPKIMWKYNSTINDTVSSTSVGSPLITVTSVLTIHNPSPTLQNQSIACLVSHQFTSTMNRTTSILMNYAPFNVQLKTSSFSPVNGSSVTFTCTARAEGSPSFRFLFVNGSSSVIVQDGSSATYTTLPLDYKDYNNYKATFQCIAYNIAGESPPQSLVLDIQVRPEISTSSAIAAVEGQDVALTCKIIAANPAARVIWRSPAGTEISTANGTVLLQLINRRQHGEYLCLAANGIGSAASKATYLSVNYGAEFIESNKEKLGCIGDTVSINCNAVGRPVPDVFLYLHGTLLKRAISNLSHNLTLDSERKFGAYVCVSNNTFGTSNVTSALRMKCIKSTENEGIAGGSAGGIIGGIIGGICFLIIILFVGIFVAKKRRQSSAGFAAEESSGDTIRGIGADMTNSAAIELSKLDCTNNMAPDESFYPSAKDNSYAYHGFVNKKVANVSGRYFMPLSKDATNMKKKETVME